MKIIEIKSTRREQLIDITEQVKQIVKAEEIDNGLVSILYLCFRITNL